MQNHAKGLHTGNSPFSSSITAPTLAQRKAFLLRQQTKILLTQCLSANIIYALMDFTHIGTQEAENPEIDTQAPNFFSAPILIVAFLETPVKEFLTQHIFQQEGFTLSCSQKETHSSKHTYLFSTITSFFRPQSHFLTSHDTKEACLYLRDEIATMPHLRAIITLGAVAHHSLLRAYQLPVTHLGCHPGRIRTLPDGLILAYTSHIPITFLQEKTHLSARLQPLRHVLGLLKQKL